MLDKQDMSADVLSEMGMIVREAAAPASPGESVKAAINRSARNLSLGYRRARAYWYGEVRLVPAQEADSLRARYKALLERRMERLDAELHTLQAELARMEKGS